MTETNITSDYKKENNTAKHNVTAIFLFGKWSATLIIPAEIARQCGLDNKVVVERKNGGLFIRKSPSEFETK